MGGDRRSPACSRMVPDPVRPPGNGRDGPTARRRMQEGCRAAALDDSRWAPAIDATGNGRRNEAVPSLPAGREGRMGARTRGPQLRRALSPACA